jgi:GNAT superfamily N-acetyltransferase
LGFGQQQVHACLDLKAYSHNHNAVPKDLTIRRACPGDEEILAGFSGTITIYQTGAPVWAPMAAGELGELRQGYAELASDPDAVTWLAFEGDQAVGMQAYFPVSPGIENPLVPDNAIELKVGSTQPQARGKGIASALTKHALWDAKEKGYAWCLIDWRSTNLLLSSFWPRFGFEPVAYRLERRVDERVGDGEQMNQMIM